MQSCGIGGVRVFALETFGHRIRTLRVEKGLSQQQLADLIYVTRKTVSNWESGNRMPDITMLSRLAECLGVETYELIDELNGLDSPPNLIIVEDEPIILKGFVHILSDTLPDAQVFGFQNGADTLQFAAGNRIAVAFMDVELSGESGIALAEKLQGINPRTNIIFLTGHSDYTGEALTLHCSGYLLKPLTPRKILNEISHLRYPVRGLF